MGQSYTSAARGVLFANRLLTFGALVLWVATTVVAVVGAYFWNIATVTYEVATLLVIAAGIASVRRDDQQGNGRLMLGIAIMTLTADIALTYPTVGPGAFLADVLPWMVAVMLGHLLLRWPRPRLQTRAQRITIWAAYAGLTPIMVIDDLFWSARAAGYSDSTWWPTLFFDRPLSVALYRVGVWCFAVLLVTFAVLVVGRIVRASRPERRELVVVAVSIALVLLDGGEIVLGDLYFKVDPNLAGNVSLAVIPLTFLASIAVRRVQRALAIEALMAHGRDSDASGAVRELRRAMGDPGLDVALYSVELGRYATAAGSPAPAIERGRAGLFIPSTDGGPLARLDVAASLAEREELSGPIADAAVIALEAARLRAELRLRADDQEESRRQLDAAAVESARLSRMLPGGVPEKLRADPGVLGRIDEVEVTVLLSDVRSYTTIAEHTPPVQLAQQLREHRSAMNGAILKEGGTVMQYVGDAVMAVFGAPFPQSDHAARAVRAAIAMHAAQATTNLKWVGNAWRPFLIGIGVSTGWVATAILGSDDRFEYTIVGDTVNLAQRLESEARPGGTTILSEATLAAAGPLVATGAQALPPMLVKGRETPVRAYRLVLSANRGRED